MKRIAYLGGSFDPVHTGHLAIGHSLIDEFELDRFVYLPAYHAPHKLDRKPASAYHRFSMLTLATQNHPRLYVSTLELDKQEERYTIHTMAELVSLHPADKVFFVMGADSWTDIRTWREWEKLLLGFNHIVVDRPGYPIGTEHVTDDVRSRLVDRRGKRSDTDSPASAKTQIYITDAVRYDVSATELRHDLADGRLDRKEGLPIEVANYIEKYELYR